MKKAVISAYLTLFLIIAVLCAPITVVYAQGENITLYPSSGFAAITIKGTGFDFWSGALITFTWDGNPIPSYPEYVWVDWDYYTFTAIINVPIQASPGVHTITAFAEVEGPPEEVTSANFTVIYMTGPPGESATGVFEGVGPPGPPGPAGPTGPAGVSGPSGPSGPMLEHEWSETSLRFEDPNSSTGWSEFIDMQGPQGEQGIQGKQGAAGEEGPPGEMGPAGGLSIAAIVMAIGALGWTIFGLIKRFVVGS